MTIDELRERLDKLDLPGNTPVVMTKDAEGNGGASPLADLALAMYAAESTWAGELYVTPEQRTTAAEGDEYDEAPDDAVLVVVLDPTN